MISLDQNCHPLWDVYPKLHALAARGIRVVQYIEDFDTAFTAVGAVSNAPLRLAKERFYRSGGADWGAALFYNEFLGRLPTEIRAWEPYTGMKTDVLARHLGVSVDDLYDRHSPGDNWQLIGPSYLNGDTRRHHTIGDLMLFDETFEHARRLFDHLAREDMERCFPESHSREAAGRFCSMLWSSLIEMGAVRSPTLTDFYLGLADDAFVYNYFGQTTTPSGFAVNHVTGSQKHHYQNGIEFIRGSELPGIGVDSPVLSLFLTHYERAAALYNQAVVETHPGLRTLDIAAGELPFFGVYEHDGHKVRSPMFLQGDVVRIADMEFRVRDGRLSGEELDRAGVTQLPGKAIVLVLQLRTGPHADRLALPYHGSSYMPTAYRFQRLLCDAGLLDAASVKPVVRVRLRFLDRLRDVHTTIALPPHLADAMGKSELPACELGKHWADVQTDARERLAQLADPAGRSRWMHTALPDVTRDLADLDRRRRALAAANEKDPQLRDIWKQIKPLQQRQLAALVQQIDRDWQLKDLGYYDSRGAIWPWCLALGGEEFYNQVIRQADVYEENA
ncbi:MAG: hypothetical protein FWE88_00625 [Phycisphaerae bacterium]|nr:hypothetical protein [Phycisphaerae bacterium]